jgi:hypothetical protein
VFGWFTGILGAVFGWLALNFSGRSILEFVKVRQEIQEELTYFSNVVLPIHKPSLKELQKITKKIG